ncbi:MAG: hypothetical protein M4579_003942 [Chaenotheca gracillima]|nr:MAG: hypothetical protein M4579_003942 [Chaenotheca gracillima]
MSVLDSMAKAALPALAATSYYCTFGMSERNDHFRLMREVRDSGPQFLPNTTASLRRFYTGYPPLDDLLTSMAVAFWPCVDGRSPNVSLYAFHFVGQILPLMVILMVEARRHGNRWRLVSFTMLWSLIGQAAGFTHLMPVYCLLHLFTSPTSSSPDGESLTISSNDLLVSPTDLYVMPLSLILGFVVPSTLAALPSPRFSTFDEHQIIMAVWQLFPAVVGSLQFVLSRLLSNFLPFEPQYRSAAERTARSMQAVRFVYLFGFAIGAVTHIAALTISISSVLLPGMFGGDLATLFHPSKVFVPPLPNTDLKVDNIADGMLYFLHYDQYLGFLSTIIWASTLFRHARLQKLTMNGLLGLFVRIAGLTLVAGPGSTALVLIWNRDELVVGEL